MPIKKPIKTNASAANTSADPRTASFSATGRTTEYVPESIPIPQPSRSGIIEPTLESSLDYFFKVANGDLIPDESSRAPLFVLNHFRATETTKKPVAERMIFGQDRGAPYYALHATPSATSVDEFNTLKITRRQPITGIHFPACVSEVLPKLNLDFEGSATIAKIVRRNQTFDLIRTGNNSVGGAIHRDSISLWTEASQGKPPKVLVQFVTNEGWESCDDRPQKGIIRARCPANGQPGSIWHARAAPWDIAYMDFTRQHPQFVSGSHMAHKIMDVLIAGFFTVLTYETRRRSHIRSRPRPLPNLVPSWVPVEGPRPAANGADIRELLECGICYEIMYNPVSLITTRTNMNDGCLHNFCGSCIVQLLNHDDRCPHDRNTITGVNDNRNLKEIIERFLEKNPEQKQSQENITSMDRIYRPGQKVTISH